MFYAVILSAAKDPCICRCLFLFVILSAAKDPDELHTTHNRPSLSPNKLPLFPVVCFSPPPRAKLPSQVRPMPRLILTLALLALAAPLCAQPPDSALTQAEIDQVREYRYYPADCVLLFVKFLDLRTQELHDLYAHPRRPGREQDTHDLIAQFTSIADQLSDNLDDYGPRHVDIRRALPKILTAIPRWSAALNALPDDDAYNRRPPPRPRVPPRPPRSPPPSSPPIRPPGSRPIPPTNPPTTKTAPSTSPANPRSPPPSS